MITRTGTGLPIGVDAERLVSAPVARLATVRPDGTPHIVAITFARSGNVLVTAVDSKPKRTTKLQRLENLRLNPAASLLVDHYDDDWTRLWWLRVDGTTDVVENVDAADAADALDALVAKYPQYSAARPAGPVIVLRPLRWSSWAASDG